MLVDAINNRLATGATPTTVEGPFHIQGSDVEHGGQHGAGAPGVPCFVTGKVRDLDGKPIGGALLDIWQTDGEGLYEAQRGAKPYMRGIYHSKPDGTYVVRTVAPIGYTIPMDGAGGRADEQDQYQPYAAGAHPFPASRRRAITGSSRICSSEGDQYIETDVVYGVKEPLIIEFVKKPAGSKAPTGETIERAVLRGALRLRAAEGGKERGESGLTFSALLITSWPGLSRPSTFFRSHANQDVDARAKPGHDESATARRR